MSSSHTFIILLGVMSIFLPGCKEERKSASGQTSKSSPGQEVKVEVRADGLAYLPGATQPFTGDAIEIHLNRTPARVARRIPYLNGLKHGKVSTYSPGRRLKEERTYDMGRPVSSDVFHINGKKKFAVFLNDKDMAEGPYKRWHDNGVLQAECTFDANERFHGEEKDYDTEGKLIGHYRLEHGNLLEIIFETPEMKAERILKSTPPTPKPASVPPTATTPES
jgi:antitoxin component YwqK of YwqJK toxin-antitoxin module